jgi:2-octaprenyl-6-methoxyphenol hydroxylase
MGVQRTPEIAVVGGGPSGLVAAISAASAGLETVLFAPEPAKDDRRTTALLDGSVRVLKSLGVWPLLEAEAAPLERLRIVDGTQRLIRAPEVTFSARELGLDAFGQNIQNETLRRALRAAVDRTDRLRVVADAVEAVSPEETSVVLRAGGRDERVSLVIAADGRQSICRRAAGIGTEAKQLSQTAIVVNLRHSRSHEHFSTEFHTESGPFTLVPLADNRSSLVWVVAPEEAQGLLLLGNDDLAEEIERRAHSILGRMQIEGERGSFPLAIELAEPLAARRIALVGEAGHLLPPIGAQGLNLGIRDAATIAEIAADARRAGRDAGDADVMDTYEARRRPDIRNRALAVEWMNRSLLSDFLPAQALRGLGLELASRFSFLRRAMMREGLGPRAEDAPRLARGEAI